MKAARTTTKNRIPDFATIEEMAEFWDTHDASEYQDELEPVEFVIDRPLTNSYVLSIRLDKETFDALREIAKPKGLGSSTLARMWILEELERVRKDAGEAR